MTATLPTNTRKSDALFAATIVLQAIAAGGAVFFSLFYFLPEYLLLGTKISAAVFLFGLASPYLSLIGRVRDFSFGYGRFLAKYYRPVFWLTLLVCLSLLVWSVIMFSEIRRRYIYLETIDQAVSLVYSDQISLPEPESLAKAFELMPDRPEVPFILGRAVRLLSPDDQIAPFHRYMQRFNSSLNRDEVLKFIPGKTVAKLSVTQDQSLPRLDPIELLTQFDVEVPDADQVSAYRLALSTLDSTLTQRANPTLALYRTSLALTLELELLSHSPVEQLNIIEQGITTLTNEIEVAVSSNSDNGRSPLIDQVYQEALDDLAVLRIRRLALLATTDTKSDQNKCVKTDADEITRLFSRILLIRRRLMATDDVIWWRPPQKLSLYHVFAHLSGLKNAEGADLQRLAGSCPIVWDEVSKLYSIPAFRPFQDPEQWMSGTPLSGAFNGAGAAKQLRKWLQLGW